MSFIKLLMPLSTGKRKDLDTVKPFLEIHEFKKVKRLLKLGDIGIGYSNLKVSERLIKDFSFPVISAGVENSEIVKLTSVWNDLIEEKVREKKYREFSDSAEQKIIGFLAPHIVGMDQVKEAAALQLFATEKVHLLLLGDPGTGKTDILRAINDVAPISSFGLGSGTSSAGLTATFKGNDMIKGLLPMADQGICCIDELNLMRARDRGSLLNAMEKGFVTYDKGNKHVRLDARVSILATANPKGDKFVGRTPETWIQQIPFDPALLSRFHLVFFTRKPNKKEFVDIAKKIVSDRKKNLEISDSLFIRDYVEFAQMLEVSFSEKLKKRIVEFSSKLKTDERKFLVDVSPRMILGIMRLAKASARMRLKTAVEEKDLEKVFKIYEKSLYVK